MLQRLTVFLLMPVLAKTFFSFVRRHFMAFSFLAAGHDETSG